jgi:flagellar biosynthesis protein FlhG
MRDQAEELRNLVRQRPPHAPPRAAGVLVVVAGGGPAAGATTAAVNLALALPGQGRGALLVDADPERSDAGTCCQAPRAESAEAIASGQQPLSALISSGPGGIQLLPHGWALDARRRELAAADRRLAIELRELTGRLPAIVVDAGAARDSLARSLWQAADLVVLVTTDRAESILEGYASVKLLLGDDHRPQLCTLASQVDDERSASDVHGRLASACGRFLNRGVLPVGSVPSDSAVAAALRQRRPLSLQWPRSPAARALERAAEALWWHAAAGSTAAAPDPDQPAAALA